MLSQITKEFLNKVDKYNKLSEAELIDIVKKNEYTLRYIYNQTEAICLEAVKRDGLTLQYVNNQTEEICLEAVKQDPTAIKYVRDADIFDKCVNFLSLNS